MAKFVNSLYTPDKSGRLASSVFGKAGSVPFEKMLGIPKNPKSTPQVNRRSQFAALSRVWGSLTDAQRMGWDSLASDYPLTKKGITFFLNGFTFFMKLNGDMQVINQPINEDAPAVVAPEVFQGFTVDVVTTPGAVDIKLNLSQAIDASTMVQLYATKVLKPGRKGMEKNLRNIGTLDSTFVNGGSIMSMYLAEFGVMPQTGQKVYFQMKATSVACGYTALPLACTAIGTL